MPACTIGTIAITTIVAGSGSSRTHWLTSTIRKSVPPTPGASANTTDASTSPTSTYAADHHSPPAGEHPPEAERGQQRERGAERQDGHRVAAADDPEHQGEQRSPGEQGQGQEHGDTVRCPRPEDNGC